MKIVCFLLLVSLAAVNSVKLEKISREILKEGLHRDLRTNISFVLENSDELACSWVFRETISKDMYIYLEEVEALKRYDFVPHVPMDVEKPSSTAKE